MTCQHGRWRRRGVVQAEGGVLTGMNGSSIARSRAEIGQCVRPGEGG